MAFETITTTEIETGKPVSNDTLTKTKANLDDHEARLYALEAGGSADYAPLLLSALGPIGYMPPTNDVCRTTTSFSLNVVGVRLLIGTAGTLGTCKIDIKKKSGGDAWVSILSTPASVAFGAGNDAVSIDAVINPEQAMVLAGDLLRLDILEVQRAQRNIQVRIDYAHA